MKKQKHGAFALTIFLPVIAVFILLCFFGALSNLENSSQDEGARQLEDAVRRAAVACYAAEGIYPPTLEYIQQHYGVQINEKEYTVVYEVFGSNMMPDITVLENN